MALATAPILNGRQRPGNRPHRSNGNGRGHPRTVTMRQTTAIAPLLEAQALCVEVIAGTERIQTAAAIGSRQLVVHEAGRLGVRATSALVEFRRMAGLLER
jgi:hypothetical protein